MTRVSSKKSIAQLKAEAEELRKEYAKWKTDHPNSQNEEIINKFLLIMAELKKRKKSLSFKSTNLDLEAKALTEIAKIKTIPIIPAEHTFKEGVLRRPHKCKYCDNPATLAVIWADGRALIPVCDNHKEKAVHQIEKINHDKVEEILSLPDKAGEYAPVNPSGDEKGNVIKLKDIEKLFKNFAVSTPVSWVVGGVVTHPEGTKNDVDILISIPSEEEFKRIIEFRISRMFPGEIQGRLHLLTEEKGGLSPFTDYLALYRLVMERIPDAEIVKMGEGLDLKAEIRLRTKGTEKQAEEANKAAREDKITFGEFFKPQKPLRGYLPGQPQTLEFFLSLWKDEQFPVFSSRKADGINVEIHLSKTSKTKIYTEDGTDETSSFPQTIEEAKKLSPGHDIIFLAEAEWWEDGQHYPREWSAGRIHKIEPDETGIVINVYDMVYYEKDIHKLSFEERWKLLQKLNFPQKTELPDPKNNWNLIPHIKNKNKEELKKETERLRRQKGSEGNVAKQASAEHDLKARRDNRWIKYHVSTTFTAIVLNSIETKTKGVYNIEYGVLAGNRPVEEKDVRVISKQKAIHVGKSFSTKENPPRGSGILIEAETINITFNTKDGTFDLTAWSPRFLGRTNKKPQTIDEIERQAIKDHVFQAKLIKDGKTHYLPGKSGEEVPSKSSEWNDYTLLFYSDQTEEIEKVLIQAGVKVTSPPRYGNTLCVRCGLKIDEDRWGVCFACAMLEDPESSDDEFLSGIEALKERGYTIKDWLEGREKTMTKPLKDGYKVNPKVIERLKKI